MSILKREILYPGKASLGELEPETKLIFHFKTVIIDKKGSNPIVIDNSKKLAKGQPVETIYGKQFKLPIWESCLTSMRIGEICQLTVRDDPVTHYICLNYAITSKCFRQHYGVEPTKSRSGHHDMPHVTHHCSMSLNHSPYDDLNKMIQNPPEIFVFTFELVDFIPPKSYTKDIWQMSDLEKLDMLPQLREDGNRRFAECDYDGAAASYFKGLAIIESLIVKERPDDPEYLKLEDMRMPFLLNLAQVKLNQGQFYDCIKHTDEVLRKDPENIKALFRRAKAHAGVWNLGDARKDFKKCIEYDKSMTKAALKCIHELEARELLKNKEDRERCARMFGK